MSSLDRIEKKLDKMLDINSPHHPFEANEQPHLTTQGRVTEKLINSHENIVHLNFLMAVNADAKITAAKSSTANQQRAVPTLGQDTSSTLRDLHKPDKRQKSKIKEKTLCEIGLSPTQKINYHWKYTSQYFVINKPPRKAKKQQLGLL